MTPALMVFGAWLIFGGSHLLLSSTRPRALLNKWLGETGFIVAYTLIAATSLTLLAVTVAQYGASGLRGLNLAAAPGVGWILSALAYLGAALSIAGLVNYPRSPMAVLARRLRKPSDVQRKPLRMPAAVEHITRHPFFAGIALLMGAHMLLASHLAGAVFFGGFALLALIGMPMQDRKLHARHGEIYGDHLNRTSAIPFAARHSTVDGTSKTVWPMVLVTIPGALLIAALHPVWQIGSGATFAGLVTVGGLFAVAMQIWRSRNE